MAFDWPCIHRGEPTGASFNCGPALGVQPVFACNLPALGGVPCVLEMCAKRRHSVAGRLQSCASCNFRESPPSPAATPGSALDRQFQKINSRREAAAAERAAKALRLPPAGAAPAGASEVAQRRLARLAPASERMEYVTSERMIADAVNLLLPQLPPNLSVVAGVPRSGMAAAAILATHLQLPLATARGGRLVELGAGSRGRNGWAGDRAGKPLIVDDSVYGGGNATRLRAQFPDALIAAVYVRPEMAGLVDFYARPLPSPHLFQWNMWNGAPLIGKTINPILHGGIALDFDGVICADPDISDRDEAAYLHWLENAIPLNVPRRHPVPLIVTFRLEKFRAATLRWMERWQIRCDRLVMHPATSHAERQFNVAEHKGHTYRDSQCRLFIESDAAQARIVFRESRKPVLCLASGEVLQ